MSTPNIDTYLTQNPHWTLIVRECLAEDMDDADDCTHVAYYIMNGYLDSHTHCYGYSEDDVVDMVEQETGNYLIN